MSWARGCLAKVYALVIISPWAVVLHCSYTYAYHQTYQNVHERHEYRNQRTRQAKQNTILNWSFVPFLAILIDGV